MTFRVSLLTIEGESADPQVWTAIRELLERAGVAQVVIAPAPAPTPAATSPVSAPASEAASPSSAGDELGRRDVEPRKPKGDKPPAPVVSEPPATPPAQPGTIGTRRVEQAIAAGSAGKLGGEAQASTALQRDKPAPSGPPVAIAAEPGLGLGERIMRAVTAQAGTSVPMLAQLLLGGSDQAKIRQIETALQPLVMRSEVYRANGRVFPSVKSAAAAPAPAKPGPKPVAQADQAALYSKLIAAYARRNDTPTTELARLLFGEPTGLTIGKVKIMTKQLCASERLKRVAWDSYRPWDEKKDRATDEDETADDGDEDEDNDGENPTESNGHPDDQEPQELEVG